MKKIHILKIFLLLLTLTLIALSALPVYATEEGEYSLEDSKYVEWEVSEDGNVIEGNGKIYTFYDSPVATESVSLTVFYFENDIEIGDRLYSVSATDKDSEIILLGDTFIYATDKGRTHLDAFLAGENVKYRLYEGYFSLSSLDESLAASLDSAVENGNVKMFNLPSLQKYGEYTVWACDSEGTVGYRAASVFDIGGELYYLDHDSLDNSFFDADGNLSYRKGTVYLTRLEGVTAERMNETIDSIAYYYPSYSYESDVYEEFGSAMAFSSFAWYYVVCPVAGIIVGVTLPQSKKLGKPKYWYIVAAVCGVALVLALTVITKLF